MPKALEKQECDWIMIHGKHGVGISTSARNPELVKASLTMAYLTPPLLDVSVYLSLQLYYPSHKQNWKEV